MSRLCPLLPSGEVSCSYIINDQRQTITRGRSSRLFTFASFREALPTGRQRFQLSQPMLHANCFRSQLSSPPDQPSHFWAAQHFLLWPRPKASLYPENSYEEDHVNFPWLFFFFFSELKTKAIFKHSAIYGEYVWVRDQGFPWDGDTGLLEGWETVERAWSLGN